MYSADLRLILNTPDQLKVLSASGYAAGMLPAGVCIPRPSECKAEWAVVLTRADYEPTPELAHMNHFLPSWPAGSVTAWEEMEHIKQQAQAVRLAFLAKIAESDRDEEVQVFTEQMEMHQVKSLACMQLLQRLYGDLQLLSREVPSEGNCGCWAILALRRGSPFTSRVADQDTLANMRQVRLELAERWRALLRAQRPLPGAAYLLL